MFKITYLKVRLRHFGGNDVFVIVGGDFGPVRKGFPWMQSICT